MLSEYKLTLAPKTIENADPKIRPFLEKAQAQMGFVPNMYLGMANSPGLLETYLQGYTLFRQGSGFTAIEQEIIFLVISRQNSCEYCMAAHSLVADVMSKVPVEVTNAIREDRAISDAKLAALATFVRVMVEKRGLPQLAEVEAFLSAGYTERQVLEIVLAVAVKTISNYSNHLFHTPVDSAFTARIWKD